MEYCFDILVPRVALVGGLYESFVSWGGAQYSQEPRVFGFEGEVVFKQQSIPLHIKKLLCSYLDVSDWECLSLQGEALTFWEKVVNDNSGLEVPLRNFLLGYLSAFDKWVLVCELNCDEIDGVYRLKVGEVVKKMDEILCWKQEPEGFIAWMS